MIWQDYAITIILWVFAISTIPLAIYVMKGKTYSPQTTNIPIAIGNYTLGIIWLTFPDPLYLSFCTNLIVGIIWTFIAIGSWKFLRNKNKNVDDNSSHVLN